MMTTERVVHWVKGVCPEIVHGVRVSGERVPRAIGRDCDDSLALYKSGDLRLDEHVTDGACFALTLGLAVE